MPHAAALHVLYIEDDRLNIVLMEEVFRRLPDWRLECAEDGGQALALLSAQAEPPGGLPDLLVVDMNLPDMSGLCLLARLRADARLAGLRCVALSADDQAEQVAAARAAGFCDYWVKPIDVLRLSEALQATAASGAT
jgi:CheY-like chemotaxis protein